MANAVRKLSHADPRYEVATVVLAAEALVTVRSPDGERHAKRAASCLVAPAAGDEVALLVTGDGRVFVIAVLVRAQERPVEISVDGDLRIAARGGSCHIGATDGVEVRAEGPISLVSKAFNLRAVEGNVVLSKLTVLASSILGHSDYVRVAAQAFESICDRVSLAAKFCQRTVDGLDLLRAGHVDYRTEKEMCLRSENFLVGARNLAKLDAEQIHIG
ncbi:MAG TPA: DUF3540 domain-containing protein [Polyangiaceae bacterium]|nr:DUF3540 domain-containing protein [Polyangiaceae bacterium]